MSTPDQGGLAATFDLAAFSGFHDRPSKEICQSFENLTEHAHNGNMFSPPFFVRDLPSI